MGSSDGGRPTEKREYWADFGGLVANQLAIVVVQLTGQLLTGPAASLAVYGRFTQG